jgi:hypothetical protein
MKNQTKSKFETHDNLRLVHQFFDYHVNFRFWIHQFDDFDDVLNNDLYFKKFTNISLFLFFLRNRSKFDEIDMKFDNVFVKENFEENLLNKQNKDDDFDQKKNDLSCQTHKDSIVYLVINKRRSKKWKKKKRLWKLINLRRLTSLTNFSWCWLFNWINDTRSWHYSFLFFD